MTRRQVGEAAFDNYCCACFDNLTLLYVYSLDSRSAFPSLSEPPSLSLSVIVPAYNEESRLPKMLREAVAYLEARQRDKEDFSYEVIIVDDGSADQTSGLGHEWSQRYGSQKV